MKFPAICGADSDDEKFSRPTFQKRTPIKSPWNTAIIKIAKIATGFLENCVRDLFTNNLNCRVRGTILYSHIFAILTLLNVISSIRSSSATVWYSVCCNWHVSANITIEVSACNTLLGNEAIRVSLSAGF